MTQRLQRRTILVGMAALAVTGPARARNGPLRLPAPLAESDFKKGKYRMGRSPVPVGSMWVSGSEYNGAWHPSLIVAGSGDQSGGGVPQASPELFAALDPVGAGFTAVIDFKLTAMPNVSTADYLVGFLVTRANPWENEWNAQVRFLPAAHAEDTYLGHGDYAGYGSSRVYLPQYNGALGSYRLALTIHPDGTAASLNGSPASRRKRAEYTEQPKPDSTFNILVLDNFAHGGAGGFIENVTFYPMIDSDALAALSAL